jgi:hypothetical protein
MLYELLDGALYDPVGAFVQRNEGVLKTHESLKYITKVFFAKLDFSFYDVCLLVDLLYFITDQIERSQSGIFD